MTHTYSFRLYSLMFGWVNSSFLVPTSVLVTYDSNEVASNLTLEQISYYLLKQLADVQQDCIDVDAVSLSRSLRADGERTLATWVDNYVDITVHDISLSRESPEYWIIFQ